MSIYEAVLKNAEPFFAWDVLSWLFIAMILAIVIVLIDLFFVKETNKSASEAIQEKSKFRKIAYFLIFLKFSKSEKYNHRPKLVQWSIELFPVLLLVFVFRGFIFEPFRVPSNSMMPTLLTGDFIVVNDYLVEQLKERGLWDAQMVQDLKYHDGSVLEIDRVPDDMKDIFISNSMSVPIDRNNIYKPVPDYLIYTPTVLIESPENLKILENPNHPKVKSYLELLYKSELGTLLYKINHEPAT